MIKDSASTLTLIKISYGIYIRYHAQKSIGYKLTILHLRFWISLYIHLAPRLLLLLSLCCLLWLYSSALCLFRAIFALMEASFGSSEAFTCTVFASYPFSPMNCIANSSDISPEIIRLFNASICRFCSFHPVAFRLYPSTCPFSPWKTFINSDAVSNPCCFRTDGSSLFFFSIYFSRLSISPVSLFFLIILNFPRSSRSISLALRSFCKENITSCRCFSCSFNWYISV